MIDTYNMREAQANLTKLCRGDRPFVIANRNVPSFVALPVEEYESMIETMEILTDPKAMRAMKKATSGEGAYRELNLDDETFGL